MQRIETHKFGSEECKSGLGECEFVVFRPSPQLQHLAREAAKEAAKQCLPTPKFYGNQPTRKHVLLSASGKVGYAFSNTEAPQAAWGPKVDEFQQRYREEMQQVFKGYDHDAILINLYDEMAAITPHSDDEKGIKQSAAGVTGFTVEMPREAPAAPGKKVVPQRMFLKDKITKKAIRVPLIDGHAYAMSGINFQKRMLHGIHKETRKGLISANRLSFTFRMHV
jgi:hypothetical protein